MGPACRHVHAGPLPCGGPASPEGMRRLGRVITAECTAITPTKCSPDMALRDIQDLVERHILERDAAGGRSTNYSLAEA